MRDADARLAKIEAEIKDLRAEIEPLRAKLRDLETRREEIAGYVRQRPYFPVIANAWAAYLAGERETILLSGATADEPLLECAPLAVRGDYVVHAAFGGAFAVSHGLTGGRVAQTTERRRATTLAKRLAKAPPLDMDSAASRKAVGAVVKRWREEMGG